MSARQRYACCDTCAPIRQSVSRRLRARAGPRCRACRDPNQSEVDNRPRSLGLHRARACRRAVRGRLALEHGFQRGCDPARPLREGAAPSAASAAAMASCVLRNECRDSGRHDRGGSPTAFDRRHRCKSPIMPMAPFSLAAVARGSLVVQAVTRLCGPCAPRFLRLSARATPFIDAAISRVAAAAAASSSVNGQSGRVPDGGACAKTGPAICLTAPAETPCHQGNG